MIHAQPSAKTPRTPAAGFVTLRAFRHVAGTGAPSCRRAVLVLAAISVSLVALMLPAAASADGRIGSTEQGVAERLAGAIGIQHGVAVSQKEGGDVYLTDASGNQRVDEFEPNGAWVRAFGWGVVPGVATATGNLVLGSTTITNATTTSGRLVQGELISGEGIAPGTEIAFVTATEIWLTEAATKSVSGATVAVAAGPGNVAVNEIQKLTLRATSGNFKLAFTSPSPGSSTVTTGELPAGATHEEVQLALEGLANLGPGNVSVSGGPGDATGATPYLIEFKGKFADANLRTLDVTGVGLSGGSPSTQASIATPVEGAGAVETCTTVCNGESFEEGREPGSGSKPGQLRWSGEIAIDNSCSQQEPPLTGSACETFDPSYGDVYVVDQRNFRVEKYDPEGHFLLMFGGGVDSGPHHPGNLCTAEYLAEGDACGAGSPGTGAAHFYQSGSLSWANSDSNSIAIGPDGRVYVGDYGRVQEFEPSGTFAGEFVLPVGGGEEPQFVISLAIDAAGDLFERSVVYGGGSGNEILSQVRGVREFDPTHTTLLHTFDTEEPSSEPVHIAVDQEGNLFLSDDEGFGKPTSGGEQYRGQDFTFRSFKPDGSLASEFSSDQLEGGINNTIVSPSGIAIGDAAGRLYAGVVKTVASSKPPFERHTFHYVAVIPLPVPGAPLVDEERTTDVEPNRATLHAVVNPREFDTHYRFQSISDAAFKANEEAGHEGFLGAEETAPVDLGAVFRPDHVQAPLTELAPSTLYHFRAVAQNTEGETKGADETFETPPAVVVRNFTTQTVGPELVTFKAELDPNGSLTTGEYTIRYGSGPPEYTCEAGNICAAHGSLPAVSNEFEAVSATFTGLQPDTTYHYQLIAHDQFGNAETADATFTTEPSAAEEHAAELEECANATRRQEGNSTALPDCRSYEQVSERNKEGGEVFPISSIAPAGERVVYESNGVFAGAEHNQLTVPYLAQRTSSGWVSQSVIRNIAPPRTQTVMIMGETGVTFSAELDRWLMSEVPGRSLLEGFFFTPTTYFSMGFADGSSLLHASPTFEPLEGEPRQYYEIVPTDPYNAAADLSRLYFVTDARLLPSDPRPDGFKPGTYNNPPNAADRIYELSGFGGPSPSLALVAELPLGLSPFETNCAIERHDNGGDAPWRRGGVPLVSADGSTIVYDNAIENVAGQHCGNGTANPMAFFAHHSGSPSSFQINASPPSQCHLPHPCASAPPAKPVFDGLSPDGRRAWFTTTQPLVDSDADETGDLYLAKLGEGGELSELVQASAGEATASHPVPGEGAGVQGAVRMSPDGSHVAFVATGVLTAEPNANGDTAQQGAENLYVYDAETEETKFVADLGGETPWSPPSSSAAGFYKFAADARYLLVPSAERLTADDTDNAPDLYRYDFQTGRLIRLSFGRDGNDGNGNDSAYEAVIRQGGGSSEANVPSEDSTRAISADGSRAIFETSAPLVSSDTNEASDVYEWEEAGQGSCREGENGSGGCVRLISDGVDPNGVQSASMSSSGRDITFHTSRGEVPWDGDGTGDIYDAREGGGFPRPAEPTICRGAETCRGSGTGQSLQSSFTSEETHSGGNGAQPLKCGKGRHRVKKHGEFRCVPNHHKAHHKKGNRRHRRATRNQGGNR